MCVEALLTFSGTSATKKKSTFPLKSGGIFFQLGPCVHPRDVVFITCLFSFFSSNEFSFSSRGNWPNKCHPEIFPLQMK